jgi:hypothetical protein
MHAWAPGDARTIAHLSTLDHLIGETVAAAPDAAFFATADHGMNGKRLVYDLAQALPRRQAPVRFALSAEKDRYVRHHRTFGGTAWVWLNQPSDETHVAAAISALPGVESVLRREEAATRFHLNPDRIGDLVVLGDRSTVFGELPPRAGIRTATRRIPIPRQPARTESAALRAQSGPPLPAHPHQQQGPPHPAAGRMARPPAVLNLAAQRRRTVKSASGGPFCECGRRPRTLPPVTAYGPWLLAQEAAGPVAFVLLLKILSEPLGAGWAATTWKVLNADRAR